MPEHCVSLELPTPAAGVKNWPLFPRSLPSLLSPYSLPLLQVPTKASPSGLRTPVAPACLAACGPQRWRGSCRAEWEEGLQLCRAQVRHHDPVLYSHTVFTLLTSFQMLHTSRMFDGIVPSLSLLHLSPHRPPFPADHPHVLPSPSLPHRSPFPEIRRRFRLLQGQAASAAGAATGAEPVRRHVALGDGGAAAEPGGVNSGHTPG